jgi:hypothetical protein
LKNTLTAHFSQFDILHTYIYIYIYILSIDVFPIDNFEVGHAFLLSFAPRRPLRVLGVDAQRQIPCLLVATHIEICFLTRRKLWSQTRLRRHTPSTSYLTMIKVGARFLNWREIWSNI